VAPRAPEGKTESKVESKQEHARSADPEPRANASSENPLASPPHTPAEAGAAVHARLRKAHYERVHGDATRALRFVQHAQKLMPQVEQGLEGATR
jgi:hypothetical protein